MLGAVAGIVVLAGGGSDARQAPEHAAPEDCLRAWNSDEEARAFTRHNVTGHGYTMAQVGFIDLGADPTVSGDRAAGDCVVIFARSSLDPEIIAAGEVQVQGTWMPLSELLDPNVVAELQSEASEGSNAEPTSLGELAPL
jgi:hypothetical protein